MKKGTVKKKEIKEKSLKHCIHPSQLSLIMAAQCPKGDVFLFSITQILYGEREGVAESVIE